MTSVRGRRKVRAGRVIGDKMDKTVVVAVERRVHHPLYGKSLRMVTRFKVHDAENRYKVGDLVNIVETRPLSRTKTWRVLELLSQREVPETQPIQAIEEDVAEALAPVSVQEAEAPAAEEAVEEAETEPEAEAPVPEEEAQEKAKEEEGEKER